METNCGRIHQITTRREHEEKKQVIIQLAEHDKLEVKLVSESSMKNTMNKLNIKKFYEKHYE